MSWRETVAIGFAVTSLVFWTTSWGADYEQTTITHISAKQVERGDLDTKIDDLFGVSNPKIRFRVAKTSPYRNSCIQCVKDYEVCWQKRKDEKRYLGDPCVGEWQGCVLDKKASCSIWQAK